jgi:arylsulfatase A-like enzyme
MRRKVWRVSLAAFAARRNPVRAPDGITRVIVVVLDGLRPDAIHRFALPSLSRLLEYSAHTLEGRTVRPSVTAAALASLFTGVSPDRHGIRSERMLWGALGRRLTLLPRVLGRGGVPVVGHMRRLPDGFRTIGTAVAARLGVRARFEGTTAAHILDAALPSVASQPRGVHYFHWPDADDAGHASGWMSPGYAEAARNIDAALGRLVRVSGVLDDPGTVLIALADHGGGGRTTHDHDSDHPLDTGIPIVVAGGQVHPALLAPGSSPLDVCATIPWLFGIANPPEWSGRPLMAAFGSGAPGAAALGVAA